MLAITLLFKENLNSIQRSHGKKESKIEMNAEIAGLKKEEKDVRIEEVGKKDLVKRGLTKIDNKDNEEARENVAGTDR
jgi:hypothetical protein